MLKQARFLISCLAFSIAASAATAATTTSDTAAYRDDMKLFAERHARFERTGEAPTVPPSLSADPHDPEFVFLGYMPIATPEQEAAHFARLRAQPPKPAGAAELKALDAPLSRQEIAGVFVNDAGEKWGFKPRNLEDRLYALRHARGASALRSADAKQGTGPEEIGEIAEKNILGGDNRILRSGVNGFDMKGYPWRALGVLVPDGTNTANVPAVNCSATKIGERHLLTSAHCVFTEGGGEGSLMKKDWWPGGDGLKKTISGGDPSPNGFKNIQWYYYDKKYVNSGWDSRDFSVLVLYDSAATCGLGWFGYRVDNSLAGSMMWNFGYPGQSQTCSASPRADHKCGGSMYGMEAKITRTEVPYLFYKHDVTPGHSGSALYDFNGGNRQLVGIVKGDYTGVENRGIKINSLVFDFIDSVRDQEPSAFCHP